MMPLISIEPPDKEVEPEVIRDQEPERPGILVFIGRVLLRAGVFDDERDRTLVARYEWLGLPIFLIRLVKGGIK